MEVQRDTLFIGIDLDDSWTQVSYFRKGMTEPETISTIAGGQRYRIPTALCKRQEAGSWYLVDARGEQEEFCRVDMLLERSLQQEQVSADMTAEELFSVFLRKILRLIPDFVAFEEIQGITIHLRELTRERAQLLWSVFTKMGIPRERIFIQDSRESFCHFAMHQKKELMQHIVVLFQCEEHKVSCYLLKKEEHTVPKKVFLEEQELGSLPEISVERDKCFAKMAAAVLHGQIVSSVYLVGEGFEGGWLQESLQVLCRGRRVFQGKNLYTRGACYESMMHMHKKKEYIYFNENILSNNIYLQVRNGNQTFYKELAEAGVSRYELAASCQVLLSGEAFVELWLQPPDSKEARVERLQLIDLPKRPPKATRLLIEVTAGRESQILVRIADMGFGEWYPSSKKVWEYNIDE